MSRYGMDNTIMKITLLNKKACKATNPAEKTIAVPINLAEQAEP